MDFGAKVQILSEFAEAYKYDDEFEEFFDSFDLGLPLAVVLMHGGVKSLTSKGSEWLLETWEGLCDQLQVDPYGEYADIDAMMEFSDEV
jgi:hypothetical protein